MHPIYSSYLQNEHDAFVETTNTTSYPSIEPTASVCSSIMSMILSVIGPGVLAVPYAVAQTGWAAAGILLLITGCMNMLTLHLNIECARQLSPHASYSSLCQRTLPRLNIAVDLSVAFTVFGSGCGYLVVIGDLLPDAVRTIEENHGREFLEDRRFWISLMVIVFIFPLVRMKRMDSLRFTSFISVCCLFFMMFIVILYAFMETLDPCTRHLNYTQSVPLFQSFPVCNGEIEPFPSDFKGIFKALPVYFMAYAGQFNCSSMVNELRGSTRRKLKVINICSLTICMVIYSIIGFGAYLTYGNEIDNNILLKYPHSNSLLILRVAYSISLALSYPLTLIPVRKSLSSILFGKNELYNLGWWQFYGITYGVVLASFGVAMSDLNITHILGFVGSSGIPMIAFVLPGLFYYYFDFGRRGRGFWRYCAILSIVFGLIFIPFSLTLQFI